jgi:hypothetical protein
LFKAQPLAALDAFFEGSNAERFCQAILDVSHHHDANPLDAVPANVLCEWCDRAPAQRYMLVARMVNLFNGAEWSEAAMALLARAPDRVAVLQQFFGRLRPMSWSGSRAVAMEMRLPLLRVLETHPDSTVASHARSEEARLKSEIDQEREHERREDSLTDERFE